MEVPIKLGSHEYYFRSGDYRGLTFLRPSTCAELAKWKGIFKFSSAKVTLKEKVLL